MHALRRRASRVRVHARVRFLTVFFFFLRLTAARRSNKSCLKRYVTKTYPRPRSRRHRRVVAVAATDSVRRPPVRILARLSRATTPALEEHARNPRGIDIPFARRRAVARPRPIFPAPRARDAAVRRHHPPPVPPVRRHHSRIHHHHLPPPVRAVRMKPTTASSAEPEPAAAPLRASASSPPPPVRPSRALTLRPHPTPRRRFQRIQTHSTQRRIPTDDGSKIHHRAHFTPLALPAVFGTSRRRIDRPRRRPPRSRLRALAKRSSVPLKIPRRRPLAMSPLGIASSTTGSSITALASVSAPTAGAVTTASSSRARDRRVLVVGGARRRHRHVVVVHPRRVTSSTRCVSSRHECIALHECIECAASLPGRRRCGD